MTLVIRILIGGCVLALGGCKLMERGEPELPVPFEASDRLISYSRDVKPVLDRKCIACHACYDAPCQLKLSSGPGLARGATSKSVYDSSRLLSSAPTRLFVDAKTPEQWRGKGFFPVVSEHDAGPQQNLEQSLISKMIALGRENSLAPHSQVPDHIELGLQRKNECPKIPDFDEYARKKPLQGMPLAITGLSNQEYQVLQNWVAQGAVVDTAIEMPPLPDRVGIESWETFLNQSSPRARLVARYLYEHLFLADLYFKDTGTLAFYHLVRSTTPPGQPVDVIATVRPNDDPGELFYYRLRRKQATVVHKTHTVYALSEARRQRIKELFMDTDWSLDRLPGYSRENAVNPFRTFSAIPAGSRYRFLLDDAEYFVRTFIRGPVCRGQIATNVINDRFFVLFQDPDQDLSVRDVDYLDRVTPFLAVGGSSLDIIGHKLDRNEYIRLRGEAYRDYQPQGPSLSSLWYGDDHNDGALLTVFRHFDNATVVKGFVGDVPKTLWVMDFPLLERTYYALVANFNVFGSVGHQASVRLYFDLIRTGAENNFLHFMPPQVRTGMRKSWYRGTLAELKSSLDYEVVNETLPVQIDYRTNEPKAGFIDLVRKRSGISGLSDNPDFCAQLSCDAPAASPLQKQADAAIRLLTSRAAGMPDMNFIYFMPDVLFLRVSSENAESDLAYTLVRNKAHSNVAFMFEESERREKEKDTLTAYRGLLGSYPNFIFVVPASGLDSFAARMRSVRSWSDFRQILTSYGIERTHPEIWTHFHWFAAYMERSNPVQAGIYDMNRYFRISDFEH